MRQTMIRTSHMNDCLCTQTWKMSLTEPQKTPNQSGFTWTKMLMTSKKGANSREKLAIFETHLLSLLDCLYCWQSAVTAASISCDEAYSRKDDFPASGKDARKSSKTVENRAVGSKVCRFEFGDVTAACWR